MKANKTNKTPSNLNLKNQFRNHAKCASEFSIQNLNYESWLQKIVRESVVKKQLPINRKFQNIEVN